MKGLVDEQDIEETKKLSAQEKFKRSMARAGYDMDAGAKRLQDLLDKQKKEREEFEKKEKEIKEGPAVDAYMAGKSPAIAHFADQLDKIEEDETLQYAAEVTPKVSPYAGVKDRKFRGAIGEAAKQVVENPNESPTDAGYQEGGWRKMNEEELDEDLRKWFKEKWVRFGPDGKIRGACARGDDSEGKPKCLPQAKAHALGKKGRKYAAAKKRREDPNPERSGPAKNVATKKKSNEGQGVAEGYTGRETKDGTWRVFKDGKAVAVAGPFKSREEAAAWIKKQKQGVAEGSDYEREPLYHATLKAFEPSITRSGLMPGGNLRMFDWSDKNYVYLSNYPDIARDFVDPDVIEPSEDHEKQILKLMKQGGVILKIDQNKLDRKLLSVDPHFQRDEDTGVETYVYSGIISPNAIIGKEYFPININESMQGVGEGFSDISGLLSASNLNKSFIITAELAEGGKKKFRVKAQNERVAIEKFKKHHSMAKIINVAEEGVEEGSKYPRNPASYHLKKYPVPQDQLARPVKKEPKKPEKKPDEKLDELKCWFGYTRVKGVPAGAPGSCKKKTNEEHQQCPECGGAMYEASLMNEKKDACYYKVKSRYKVWPSAYASGALVKCRKKGAKNWGSKSKSNEGQIYSTGGGAGQAQRYYTPKDNLGETKSNILFGLKQVDEGLKSRLAGAALAAAMAAGGSQARVSIGPDGQLTPSFAQHLGQQSGQSSVEPAGGTIERTQGITVNREDQTLEYKGKTYSIIRITKDGPQPRIARFDAKITVPMADLGFRGIGTLPTTLAGDSAYVYLP